MEKDSYYEEQSHKAINDAVEAGKAAGKSVKEIRFLVRRSYPFGPLRKGQPYKIWNRLVLAKEAELGLEVRKHKVRPAESEVHRLLREAIEAAAEKGKSVQESLYLIRKSYPLGNYKEGGTYKLWHRLMLAKEVELKGE